MGRTTTIDNKVALYGLIAVTKLLIVRLVLELYLLPVVNGAQS